MNTSYQLSSFSSTIMSEIKMKLIWLFVWYKPFTFITVVAELSCYLLYHRSIYKIYFDIFFYLFARLDGRAGDSPVPEVTPTDRPLTHPTSGTSYASSVKKPESSVVPPGKAWESSKQGAPPLSPVCVAPGHVIGSYAAVLKKKGGPQDVSEPLSPSCEIDEILCDPGNNNF